MTDTAIIILAAGGKMEPWHGEKPRHFLPVGLETIIGRTIRQTGEHGDITVVTHREDIREAAEGDGAGFFEPEDSKFVVNTMRSTESLWKERTVILMGDVIFSPNSIGRIFKPNKEPTVKVFGNRYEIFAITFDLEKKDEVIAALDKAVAFGFPGSPRKFYLAYCGFPLGKNAKEETVLQWVDDCWDVDSQRNWTDMKKKIKNGDIKDVR